LVERAEAKALTERDLIPSEAITVVLSEKGWIRHAKGYDVAPTSLSYTLGDNSLAYARGKSNLPAILIGSDGRSYALESHSLPSARSQGEPVTGRLNLTPGTNLRQVLMADDEQMWLMGSDAGYGFICKSTDMVSKNKSGKALLTVPEKAKVMAPQPISNLDTDEILVITNEGRMLLFPIKDLPQLCKGKGNKIINIPSARSKSREEFLSQLIVLPQGEQVMLHAVMRKMGFKASDLDNFRGERGRRGTRLPRGLQNVTRLEITSTAQASDSPE